MEKQSPKVDRHFAGAVEIHEGKRRKLESAVATSSGDELCKT